MQHDDFRDDLPVSRGQYKRIAEEALRVLGEPAPVSRWDATVMLVRLGRTDAGGDREPVAAAEF